MFFFCSRSRAKLDTAPSRSDRLSAMSNTDEQAEMAAEVLGSPAKRMKMNRDQFELKHIDIEKDKFDLTHVDTDNISVCSTNTGPSSTASAAGAEAEPMADVAEVEVAEDLLAHELRQLMESVDRPIDAPDALTAEKMNDFETALKPMTTASNRLMGDDMATMNLNKREQAIQKAYSDAVGQEMVDPRSHIGQIFRKTIQGNSDEKDKYSKMTRPEASRFRLEWAKKEFTKFKDSKVATKTWRRVDTQKGDYLNMDQLVHDQGGWQSSRAVQGAVRLVRKCVAMGPPWMKKHPQTERLMFLRLHFQFVEEFDESWSHFKEEFSNGFVSGNDGSYDGVAVERTKEGETMIGVPAPSVAERQVADVKLVAVVDGKSENKDKEKQGKDKAAGVVSKDKTKKDAGVVNKEKPVVNPEIKQFTTLCAKASKVKNSFLTTLALGMEMMKQIDSVAEWKWANNPENKGVLQSKLSALNGKLNEFHRMYITSDLADLKKNHSTSTLSTELTAFAAFAVDIDAVNKYAQQMKKRHQLS